MKILCITIERSSSHLLTTYGYLIYLRCQLTLYKEPNSASIEYLKSSVADPIGSEPSWSKPDLDPEINLSNSLGMCKSNK
jgi:hypothetical protein